MKTSKKKSLPKLPEHYTDIDDLNMLSWIRIHKKKDMIYLLKKPKKINEAQRKELNKVWDKIYYEYILTFGFGDAFMNEIDQKLKIARLKNKQVITGDDSLINIIRANEIKLQGIQKRTTGSDIYKTKEAIEKKIGIRIPLAECSVREFYSYLKNMK